MSARQKDNAILTGAGERAFCAGGDLARTMLLMSGDRPPEDEGDRRLLCDPAVLAASGLREFPLDKPVIAAVNGACMVAGLEPMLGTDIRFCAEHKLLTTYCLRFVMICNIVRKAPKRFDKQSPQGPSASSSH